MALARRFAAIVGLGCVIATMTGCGALIGLLSARGVTIQLVNNGDFDVEVDMFTSDDQNVLEVFLTEFGERVTRTIAPGETVTVAGSCDDVQAIIISDADLRVVGGVGPEADTDVLRDGDDFSCGDSITFTFDHSALITDFDVAVTVAPGLFPF